MITATSLALALLASGCAYEEGIPEVDLRGTVRIPAAATQFQYGEDLDNLQTIDDPRGLGPVYLGVFPSVQEGLYVYPHPELGPVLDSSEEGSTYPYGGTTIGRFDWACYQALACKVVTGRFTSYEDILDFFSETLGEPVLDPDGNEVGSETEFQERCYEVMDYAGDNEILFLSEETDFELDGDELVAEVELPHTFFEKGMAVWGWVDMPSRTYDFSTCDDSVGEIHSYYSEYYEVGTNPPDVLNFPGNYIDSGDWIVQDPAIIDNAEQKFDLEIGFHYADE